MGVVFQIIGTAILCTVAIDMGLIFTWPASCITLFSSQNTTLNRPMSETEISLLGSLSSVGAVISTAFGGILLDKLGRKKCCVVISLCMILFWVIVTFSRNVEVVLIGIFLSGVASAIILTSTVYISEICQESIRGSMTSANMVAYGFGMLISYGIGGYLEYNSVLYICLAQSVLRTCLLLIVKESPMYLMQIGKEKEAARVIAYYRNLKPFNTEVVEEMNTIRSALNPELDESTPETEKLQTDFVPAKKLSFWQFMGKSKSSRQAFYVTVVTVTASIYQGFVVIQMYVDVLFVEEIPSISPTVGSVAMAAIAVVAGVVTSYLTDIVGRRFLMIYASIGSGLICVVLGTQMQIHWGPNWITALFIYALTVTYTLGAGTVPFVLMADVFLPEVKSILSTLIIEWVWLNNFVILFIFNPLLSALGWGPVHYIFAAICFATSAYCAVYLPETTGLTVNEIQLLFQKKK